MEALDRASCKSAIVIAVAVVGLYVWYAAVVKRKTRVAEALSGIDVDQAARLQPRP